MCQPGWEGRLEENGYMFNTVMVTCMAESLHPCSLETITTLLTGYTQYKIKSLKFFLKKELFFLKKNQSFGLCGRGRGWDDLGEWH